MSPKNEPGKAQEGTVLIYSVRHKEPPHERSVHEAIGERIAGLLGMRFGGHYENGKNYPGRVYLIPTDTIIGAERIGQLGLRDETDLFGGAAPYPFVPTKVITHALIDDAGTVPIGWSAEFGGHVGDAVLEGFSAFTLEDAQRAGERLLERGPVRIKPVLATAGRGQEVARNASELREALNRTDTHRLADCGIVLEQHLDDVKTFSVGRARVGDHEASYVGVQSLTPDNKGEMVYGGSLLHVTRGGFEKLLALAQDEESRIAIEKAMRYDEAANLHYPGLLASRRNYDIALGRDSQGQWRCGVLEQSWRIGGASAAEIAALEALRDDPSIGSVYAETVERFGPDACAPPGALVTFEGEDPDVGHIVKYVQVRPGAGRDAPRSGGPGPEDEDPDPPMIRALAS